MENTINQRIKEFINSIGMNDNQFAKSIGVTQSVISSMFLRNTEPSSKVLVAILNAYAELSAEWLLRGEGEMFKSKANSIEGETGGKICGDFEVDENGYLKIIKLRHE